jgi:phosphohistidine phosphatase
MKTTEDSMDLILWRHAEAEDATAKIPDAKRRLTDRGEKQARKMAKWLRERLPKNTRILVSPAQRAQMTAHALGLPFETEPWVGVGATATDILAAAGWPQAGGAVLVVGHQPTLGQVAARLLGGEEANWAIKKGAAWWFSRGREQAATSEAWLRCAIGPSEI